ncbi:MAG: hypothetical protein A2381_17090 [Bdellovibrionales bacterium RIFOXYB1_FULL_37_110]|nr:MAG: hypothetical protein A2181_08095 [Bdellovibrionales bacterium RIFOXYA1_FULL_38_20]OFZ50113.1 MAG: hypothetical protein A2417_18925 [Bdellovibrionales bacterium RIFOXYC1_FULL_37_79]OFZ60019.1 MAG: hypothetical protein A2381_17090 [Bdellovibrionales bacterium RIFOXYB1_FULL_37_110]OFZ64258.1 MAG: hypothetical protein A2577_12565 [Bdellovibrionales bacterium RIFOXYD1_FULL_36_51]
MKKMALLMMVSMLSIQSFAGCLSSVEKMINDTNSTQDRKIALVKKSGTILQPGEEYFFKNSDFVNDTNKTVELFYIEESNGYFQVVNALLLEATTCKLLKNVSVGDEME